MARDASADAAPKTREEGETERRPAGGDGAGRGGPDAREDAAGGDESEGAEQAAGLDDAGAQEQAEGRDEAATDAGDGGGPTGGIAAMQEELASLRDRLARARADYDNLQKRVSRDAGLERERIKARFLEEFLRVYEFSRMAEAEAAKQPGPLADGVRMVVREFDRLLIAEGVVPIGLVGEPFDPQSHEAVAAEPADGVARGAVSRVVRPGYRLGARVLRHAKVAVAPSDSPQGQSEE